MVVNTGRFFKKRRRKKANAQWDGIGKERLMEEVALKDSVGRKGWGWVWSLQVKADWR